MFIDEQGVGMEGVEREQTVVRHGVEWSDETNQVVWEQEGGRDGMNKDGRPVRRVACCINIKSDDRNRSRRQQRQ